MKSCANILRALASCCGIESSEEKEFCQLVLARPEQRNYVKIKELLNAELVSPYFQLSPGVDAMYVAIHWEVLSRHNPRDEYFDSRLIDILLSNGYDLHRCMRFEAANKEFYYRPMLYFLATILRCLGGKDDWNATIEANLWKVIDVFKKHRVILNNSEVHYLKSGGMAPKDSNDVEFKILAALAGDDVANREWDKMNQIRVQIWSVRKDDDEWHGAGSKHGSVPSPRELDVHDAAPLPTIVRQGKSEEWPEQGLEPHGSSIGHGYIRLS